MKEGACVVQMPKNITYDEAILPYGAVMVASALLRKADIRPGHNVLVIGAAGASDLPGADRAASGSEGCEGVCGGPRAEFVRALGADRH